MDEQTHKIEIINFSTMQNEYLDLYRERCPNGDVLGLYLQYEGSLPNFPGNGKKFVKELFSSKKIEDCLSSFNIRIRDFPIKNQNIEYHTDGFHILADLARKLFLGGSYFSTMVSIGKYSGQKISELVAFEIASQLMEQANLAKLTNLRTWSINGTSWNTWYDLDYMDYLSGCYFVLNPITNKAILLLFKDSD